MILVFSRSRGKRLRSGLRGPRIPSDHRGSWVMTLIPRGGLTSQVETWKMLEDVICRIYYGKHWDIPIEEA